MNSKRLVYPRPRLVYPGLLAAVGAASLTLTLPPGVANAAAGVTNDGSLHGCDNMHLCLFSEPNYTGRRLSLYYCGFQDLRSMDFPDGGKWNKKISSWVNNQSPGTRTYFYRWNGSSDWVQVASSIAKSTNPTPAYNDVIDGIHVC